MGSVSFWNFILLYRLWWLWNKRQSNKFLSKHIIINIYENELYYKCIFFKLNSFETADINEPTPEGESDSDTSPLLLILGYGSGVQVWLIPPTGDAQEVLSWRQGTVRVLRILPTPQHGDCFASKRPLIALCDSAGPGPSFCALSFISIRGGEQVCNLMFCEILENHW